MLAAASADPATLVLGIDANAAGMVEGSRRALQKRGGLPNALFVVAAAEALPAELDGLATAISITFPWGSLLRALLDAEPAILGGLARVSRPGAMMSALLSVTEHDRLGRDCLDAATFERLAPSYAATCLSLVDARPATAADVRRSHSTWAKRLRAGASRPVWSVRWSRSCGPDHPVDDSRHALLAGTSDGTESCCRLVSGRFGNVAVGPDDHRCDRRLDAPYPAT